MDKSKKAAPPKAERKEEIHICRECGKATMAGEPAEHIVTKRRTELWFHQKCIGGRRQSSEPRNADGL